MIKNEKPARRLVIEQNATIDFRKNQQNGEMYFTCGNIKGYVSANAELRLLAKNPDIDDFMYVEVTMSDGNCLPYIIDRGIEPMETVKQLSIEPSTSSSNPSIFPTMVAPASTPMSDYDDDLP